MRDPIYAGIEIKTSVLDGAMLHALNNLYNSANNSFSILMKVNPEDVAKACNELKVPAEYTMQVIAEQKDTAYNMLHYSMLKPFINDLNSMQKEYIHAMATFFNEVYGIAFMRQVPNNESKARSDKAFVKLAWCLQNKDKIFTEELLGPNFHNKLIVDFLTKQLTEILDAQKIAAEVNKETKTEENNDSKDTDTPA